MSLLKVALLSCVSCDIFLELVLFDIIIWKMVFNFFDHVGGDGDVILHRELDCLGSLVGIDQKWDGFFRLVIFHEVLCDRVQSLGIGLVLSKLKDLLDVIEEFELDCHVEGFLDFLGSEIK